MKSQIPAAVLGNETISGWNAAGPEKAAETEPGKFPKRRIYAVISLQIVFFLHLEIYENCSR